MGDSYMAHRNLKHDDLSLFKNRLWKLMESRDINTAKRLAKALYDGRYVVIKQKESFDDPSTVYNRAIDGVEKKIQKHLNSDNTDKLQGEYIKAYCDFFGCSADYLFGYINLPTKKQTDLQEVTGFSEKSVQRIIGYKNDFLDILISSSNFYELDNLFDKLIHQYDRLQKDVSSMEYLENEAEKYSPGTAEYTEIHKQYGDIISDTGRCEDRIDGITYKLGIAFGTIIEQYQKEQVKIVQEMCKNLPSYQD